MFNKKFFIFLFSLILIIFKTAYGSGLISHQANYSLTIKQSKDNGFIQGGHGRTVFNIKKVCEGWVIKENFILSFITPNKKITNSYSEFKTFESLDNKRHSFELDEKSDLNGNIKYEGFVENNNEKIIGFILDQNKTNINLDSDVLFPTAHIQKLINQAKIGKKYFNSKVFFGSELDNMVKIASAFIGNSRKSKLNEKLDIKRRDIWPIKIAFYNVDTKNSNPDYEIKLEIDDRGVVYFYEVDYGNFVMEANLVNLKILEKKILCN